MTAPCAYPLTRPPALFVGRGPELERFAAAAEHVRLLAIYGAGGIGKTAFMLEAGERLAMRVGGRLVYHECRDGEGPSTLALGALAQLDVAPEQRSTDALAAFAAAAQSSPIVLCIDNAHLPTDASFFEAIGYLARRRLPLWVCAASREALPFTPAVIDHLTIRLGGLTSDETRLLWLELERLYGPSPRASEQGLPKNPLMINVRGDPSPVAINVHLDGGGSTGSRCAGWCANKGCAGRVTTELGLSPSVVVDAVVQLHVGEPSGPGKSLAVVIHATGS